MAMTGNPRDYCVQALLAAGGDPNLAYEILTTGVAQMMAAQGTDGMAALQNMADGEDDVYGDEAGEDDIDDPALQALQEFTDSPQFEAVRARMLEDP